MMITKKKIQIELNFTGLEQLALKEFLLNWVKGIFIKLGQASFWTPIKQVSCKDPFMFKLVNCIRKIVWDKENENKKHMRMYVVIVIYCIVLCSVLWFCLACCLFAYFSWPIYLVKSLPREKHREFSRSF